jgi:hypothetical protein|tara:strand:+ start:235 stop:738 length:504 start_codon:yes stop_codon:yes gene_type:complete
MKHLLLALLLSPTFLLGQTRKFRPDKQSYIEANTGIGVKDEWQVSDLPFTSLTIGRTSDFGDYSLIDVSIGVGFPDIWTAKIGLGSYYDMGGIENVSIILGVRFNPAMVYTQVHVKHKEQGFFTFSTELGTGYSGRGEYKHLLNIGYKWPLILKKKKNEPARFFPKY